MMHKDAELFRMMPKQTRIQPYRLPQVTLMSYRSESSMRSVQNYEKGKPVQKSQISHNYDPLWPYDSLTQYDLLSLMAFIYISLAS